MKYIKFEHDWNIWLVFVGHSGGKKSEQHKIINYNLMMLIKNNSYSRIFYEYDLRDVLWVNGIIEVIKRIFFNEMMHDGCDFVFYDEFKTVLGNLDKKL